MDKRKYNKGTKGNNGGRPSKAEELKLLEIGIEAIEEVYGSQKEYWIHIAKESKESYPHLKLLTEYLYGKPKETKDINLNTENSIFKTIDLDVSKDNGSA